MTQSVKLRFSGVRGPRTMRYRCMLLRTTKGIPNSFARCVTLSAKSLESMSQIVVTFPDYFINSNLLTLLQILLKKIYQIENIY